MKTKQLPAIDQSKYDHLDNAPLVVWIQEFLKRNHEFQLEYAELNNLAVSRTLEEHIKLLKLFEAMTDKWGFMPIPERIYLKPDFDMSKYGQVALPREPVAISSTTWQQLRTDDSKDDILQLTIDLMFTDKEIIEAIEDILLKKRKALYKGRKHRTKWKLYLMVYDIKTQYPLLTYKEISKLLPEVYDMRTLENYYKKAEHLIHGGYKIFLTKPPRI